MSVTSILGWVAATFVLVGCGQIAISRFFPHPGHSGARAIGRLNGRF